MIPNARETQCCKSLTGKRRSKQRPWLVQSATNVNYVYCDNNREIFFAV